MTPASRRSPGRRDDAPAVFAHVWLRMRGCRKVSNAKETQPHASETHGGDTGQLLSRGRAVSWRTQRMRVGCRVHCPVLTVARSVGSPDVTRANGPRHVAQAPMPSKSNPCPCSTPTATAHAHAVRVQALLCRRPAARPPLSEAPSWEAPSWARSTLHADHGDARRQRRRPG